MKEAKVLFSQAVDQAVTEHVKILINSSLSPEDQVSLSCLGYLPSTKCEFDDHIEIMANIHLNNDRKNASPLAYLFEAVVKARKTGAGQEFESISIRGSQDFLPSLMCA